MNNSPESSAGIMKASSLAVSGGNYLGSSPEGLMDALADAYLPIPPSTAIREHERSIHVWSDCLALWLSKRK